MIRSYEKEDSKIVNRRHAANTKQSSKDKSKDKSKDVSDSSVTRRPGFSLPRTDYDFHHYVGVDNIADLPECLLKYEYGKPFLPDSLMEGVPPFMKRMHSWYMRACRLGLKTIWARYDPDIFGAKTEGINDIMFDFEEIHDMFRLKQLNIEMVRLWCM